MLWLGRWVGGECWDTWCLVWAGELVITKPVSPVKSSQSRTGCKTEQLSQCSEETELEKIKLILIKTRNVFAESEKQKVESIRGRNPMNPWLLPKRKVQTRHHGSSTEWSRQLFQSRGDKHRQLDVQALLQGVHGDLHDGRHCGDRQPVLWGPHQVN